MKFLIPSIVTALMFGVILFGCNTDGTSYSACDCEDPRNIETEVELNASTTSVTLSTYANDGDFIADASCHASMVVTFFWKDSTRASTEEMPPLNVDFESVFGYFPTGQPIKHWSDNLGIHWWRYIVNEAADSQNPEGTSYSITASYTPSGSNPGEVTVGAEIDYRVYNANMHDRTDLSSCNY